MEEKDKFGFSKTPNPFKNSTLKSQTNSRLLRRNENQSISSNHSQSDHIPHANFIELAPRDL
jgi:hypothetical protein